MSRVLVFSCIHSPFIRKGYLDFLKEVKRKYQCDVVVNAGDEMDYHMLSVHPKEPSAMGAKEEHERGVAELKKYYKAFPKAKCCVSNHTSRPYRKAAEGGLPELFLKKYNDFLEAPRGWKWSLKWEIDGVIYKHGDGYSGEKPHAIAAFKERNSIVIGHVHPVGGVEYLAGPNDLIFGMCVGCGVDHATYAMRYAQKNPKKPVIGCGVVIDGKQAIFIPMELGSRIKRVKR